MPFSPVAQWVGLTKELVRNTPLTASTWIPAESPAYNPAQPFIEDKAMRGSMVETYNVVPGIRHDELDFSSYLFADTCGHPFRGILGSPDVSTGTPSGAPDALNLAATAGATTISTVATHPAGTVLQVDTGATAELVTTVGAPTGAFILTLSTPLQFNHLNSAVVQPVVAPFTHTFSLLNNAPAIGNQPPSYTVTYFNGFNARQMPACQWDSMDLTFNAAGLVTYKTKILGLAAPVQGSPPTPVFSNVQAIPSWDSVVTLGGTPTGKLLDGTLTLNRNAKPIQTVGNLAPNAQTPYRIWSGMCATSGKLSFVYEDDTELADYLSNTQPSLDIKFTDPNTPANTIEFHMTNCMFKSGKPTAKDVMQTDVDYDAKPNSTDATAGGVSPVKVTLVNSTALAY